MDITYWTLEYNNNTYIVDNNNKIFDIIPNKILLECITEDFTEDIEIMVEENIIEENHITDIENNTTERNSYRTHQIKLN